MPSNSSKEFTMRCFDSWIPGVRSIIAVCLTAPFAYTAIANAQHVPAPYVHGTWYPRDTAWTKEAWTGDEEPFRKVRREIEAAKRENIASVRHLYLRYEQRALRDPKNAVLQYAWAYSMYHSNLEFSSAEASAPAAALASVPSPHTFEFARVRFLMESWEFRVYEPIEEFAAFSNRLLEREPQNVGVRGYAIEYLCRSKFPANQEKSVRLAHELIQLRPSDSYTHSMLGGAYYMIWNKNHNIADVRNAIAAYEESLRKGPQEKSRKFLTKILLPGLKAELAKAEAKKESGG